MLNFRCEFGPIGIGSKVSTVQNSGTPRLVVPRRPRVFFNVMFQVHVVSPMVSQPEKGYKEAKCHVCHVFFREKILLLITFHYTGWFRGIHIMAYYNPCIIS